MLKLKQAKAEFTKSNVHKFLICHDLAECNKDVAEDNIS